MRRFFGFLFSIFWAQSEAARDRTMHSVPQ